MRKKIIYLLLLYYCSANGQTPSRFPVSPDSKWKITEVTYDVGESQTKILDKYEYFINSDTLINSQQYYKLYKTGIAYYDTPFYYENIYTGAIRDDSNRIYLVDKDESVEVLLFDYNLKLGDTILSEVGKGAIINDLDSLADGRKIFISRPYICGGCCATIGLIEGIGQYGGLFETPPCSHIGFYGHVLTCFHIGDNLIFKNNMQIVDCDDFFSDIPIKKSTSEIKVYQSDKKLIIEIEDYTNPIYTVNLYDICGKKIMTQNIYSAKTELDMYHINNGIFVIQICNNKTNYVEKIIFV